jgi:hypothetical protein
MPAPDRFSIEVHFIPLSTTEREERIRWLGALLMRGALRSIQNSDRNELEGLEVEDSLSVVSAQK